MRTRALAEQELARRLAFQQLPLHMADDQQVEEILNRLIVIDTALGNRRQNCDTLTMALQRLHNQRSIVDPISKNPLNTTRQFKGRITDDWTRWLSDFNKTATACRWNADRKLEILPSLLTDHAEKVYRQVVTQGLTAQQRQDWNTVVNTLNEAFNTAESLQLKASQFHQCRQTIGEASEAFADRLQDLYEQAYPTIPAADRGRMLLDAFIKNLNPTLKTAVLCSNPNDLNTAVAAARRFEMQDTSSTISASTLLSSTFPSMASLVGALPLSNLTPATSTKAIERQNAGDEVQKLLLQLQEQMQQVQKDVRSNQSSRSQNSDQFNRTNQVQNRTRTFDGRPICFLCNKVGHVQAQCRSIPGNSAFQNQNFQNPNIGNFQGRGNWPQNRFQQYSRPNMGYQNPNGRAPEYRPNGGYQQNLNWRAPEYRPNVGYQQNFNGRAPEYRPNTGYQNPNLTPLNP